MSKIIAKRIGNTSAKAAGAVSSGIKSTTDTISSISPTKIASTATKPITSTYKATQRILNPNRYLNKIWDWVQKIKRYILIYGCIGIASLMIVNQFSYMGLLYMIRHRYDEENEMKVFGIDMTWIYTWLNIPYNEKLHEQRQQMIVTGDGKDGENVYNEIDNLKAQVQDYNISADIKLAKMAYNGLLYPRIGAAVLLTLFIGTPLLRVVFFFKP